MLVRLFHLARLLALSVILAAIVFIVGHYMRQSFRQKVAAALKAGDKMEFARLMYERQQKKKSLDSFYYDAMGSIHLKNGNVEAGKYNFDKSIELQGK